MPHKRVAKCVSPVLQAKVNTPGRGRRYQNTLFIDWSGKVSKGQKVCFRLNNITSRSLTEPGQLEIYTKATHVFKQRHQLSSNSRST